MTAQFDTTTFERAGELIRERSKLLVLDFMNSHPDCRSGGCGMKQAEIFRRCGFSFGDIPKATTTNQQFWIVAILWDLANDGLVEQITDRGPWRLC